MTTYIELTRDLRRVNEDLYAVPGGNPQDGSTGYTNSIVLSVFGHDGFQGRLVGTHDARTNKITVDSSKLPEHIEKGLNSLQPYRMEKAASLGV